MSDVRDWKLLNLVHYTTTEWEKEAARYDGAPVGLSGRHFSMGTCQFKGVKRGNKMQPGENGGFARWKETYRKRADNLPSSIRGLPREVEGWHQKE
jgi:hypothetical protein